MSWLFAALLACAVVVLIGAEWPRLSAWAPFRGRQERARAKRKASLTLLRTNPEDRAADDLAADDFAASVQRDLSQLPTIEERDRRR